ncbi:hypothetical protein HOY80DRAFT_1134757 [Tuber brumale]|nr:hypothetical protein HOY80DRAFT_1134757 [Tuber brumale]
MIESLEPQEFAQHENQTYRVVYRANILIDEALEAYSGESESGLSGPFLFKVDEMPRNTAVDMDMKAQTPLAQRIEHLETKIDSLLLRNLSYFSVLQCNPTPSLQSEPRTVSRKPPLHPMSQAINPEACFIVEVTQPVPTGLHPLPLGNQITGALPSGCTTPVVAIQRSRKGNLILYTSRKAPEIIQISSPWLRLIPYGAMQNNEARWSRRILYLSSPCTSDASLNQELHEWNKNLKLASPARLLTAIVALLFFKSDTDEPVDLYIFATCKRLNEYRQ